MLRPWLVQYPEGVPAEMSVDAYPSLAALMQESFERHRDLPAYRFMGSTLTFGELDEHSRALASWLQAQGFQRGDRVAVMLPNVPQYPIAVAAILRAGLVVVNVNPLYTARELEHQLKDSGARLIVILENFAATLQKVLDHVPVKKVLLAAMGDRLGWFKGALVNQVVRRVKKLVPPFRLPTASRFNDALARGRNALFTAPTVGPDDIAVLQYTGGTTGLSKGAVLLHRNLVANVLQSEAWNRPALKAVPPGEQLVTVCALPLYHIFAFNINMMLGLRMGACNLLIPNPRDLAATKVEQVSSFSRQHQHPLQCVMEEA